MRALTTTEANILTMLLTRTLTVVVMVVMSHQGGQVSGFNINTKLVRVMAGPSDSYYGYSVTLWQDQQGEKRVVVGAPRGRSSPVGVPRGSNATGSNYNLPLGNIHVCGPFTDHCHPLPSLPSLSYQDYSAPAVIWGDSIQSQGIGFGETLYAADQANSKLLACAPRYPRKVESVNNVALQSRGACYLLDTMDSHPTKLLPYPGPNHNNGIKVYINSNSFTGYALAGTSGLLSQDQSQVFLGGPYAFYAQGMLLRMESSGRGSLVANKLTFGQAELDNSVEGWALVRGTFSSKPVEFLAASHVGYNSGHGKVSFYDALVLKQTSTSLYGQEMGAQFGYCLGSADVDGDGVDDLLVGAPLARAGDKLLPDAGKIYLYYSPLVQNSPRASPLVLEGQAAWGRFGHAVTCPGDLNHDGFKDVVVGAPGAAGRVYIYNGGADGLYPYPTQILHASDFSAGLRGFGFSLDGGVDMDNNGYPDLVIGAPESDKVVFVRSAPVVTLLGRVVFHPSVINLENRECTIQPPGENVQEVACFDLLVDIQYQSKDMYTPLSMEFAIGLDEEQHRLGFLDNAHLRTNIDKHTLRHQVHSNKDSPHPLTVPVFVKRGKYEYKIPGSASVRVQLLPEASTSYTFVEGAEGRGRDPSESSTLPPDVPGVLDFFSPNNFTADVRMDCVDVTTCHSTPDITLHAHAPQQLMIGEEQLVLEVDLEVRNDTAYETVLVVAYPPGLHYVRVAWKTHLPDCRLTKKDERGHSTLTCRFTFELYDGDRVTLTFVFSQSPVILLTQSDDLDLTFHLKVSSDSKDLNEADNVLDLTVTKASKVNLFVDSSSEPEAVEGRVNESLSLEMLFNPESSTVIRPEMLGPRVNHRFSLTNVGPTPLLRAKVTIQLPLQLKGAPLFYLTGSPTTSGPVVCDVPPPNAFNFDSLSNRHDHTLQEMTDLKEGTAEEGIKTDVPGTEVNTEDPSVRREVFTVEDPTTEGPTEGPTADDPEVIDTTGVSVYPAKNDQNTTTNPTTTADLLSHRRKREVVDVLLAFTDDNSAPLTASVSSLFLASSSSSPTPPPPSLPRPSHTSAADDDNIIDEEIGKRTMMNVDCTKIKCETMTCEVSNLLAGNNAVVDITAFVTVATLRLLKRRTITLETRMTFDTAQLCVSVNNRAFFSDPDGLNPIICHPGDDLHPEVSQDGDQDPEDGDQDPEDGDQDSKNDNQVSKEDQDLKDDYYDSTTTDNGALGEVTTENVTYMEMALDDPLHSSTTDDQNVAGNDDTAVRDSRNATELDDGFQNATESVSIASQNDTDVTEDGKMASSKGKNATGHDARAENTTQIYQRDFQDDNNIPKDGRNSGISLNDFVFRALTEITIIERNEGQNGLESLKALGFWRLFLAVIGAVMLIIILTAILYKVGFFKRQQPPPKGEWEALNQGQMTSNGMQENTAGSVVVC